MEKASAKPKKFDGKEVETIRESLEVLNAIETLEYHNKNWLTHFANNNPAALNREKRALLERAICVIGGSASNLYT